MRVSVVAVLLGGLVGCVDAGAPPAPPTPGVVDEGRPAPVGGGVGEVVEARCPMPIAGAPPAQRVRVAPTGGCEAATFVFPLLRVRDADGDDVFAGAVTQASLTTEQGAEACIFHVRVFGLVPPDKPEGETTAPEGVDVVARLCDARWEVGLPLAGLAPPVLRDLFFLGDEGQSRVVVPGARALPVGPRPEAPRCLSDTTPVDVAGFALGLGFTLEVPHATLARTTSQAMGGEAVITFDLQPR